MCIENLDGDYYIPGSVPDGAQGIWKEIQDIHSVAQKLYPRESWDAITLGPRNP